ncbi:DUF2382 domain-containing protein [uncultured Amnibacterium sp.]|uniref:DUF2382 domain-containing protein n=1 Tax=uncultured Amnibacterium sp. TaxID=1631851 RepID=UPI0035CC8DDD
MTIDSSSINDLAKAKVIDSAGDKVGTVGQVYVDENDGHPLFATVHTGLFGTSESFVPLDNGTFDGETLHVGYTKAIIKDAPNIADDGALDDAEQDRIFDYYNGASTSGSASDATFSGSTETTTADTSTSGYTTSGSTDTTGRVDSSDTGYDTSGPTTDDAVTRSEERLNVGVQNVQTGRARLRKHIVTEQQTVTVPVSHDEVHLEREPITDANAGAAYDGPAISEEEHEVVLTEERPVVAKETVPVERVRLEKETVTENQQVTDEVRKEQIDFDGADSADGTPKH